MRDPFAPRGGSTPRPFFWDTSWGWDWDDPIPIWRIIQRIRNRLQVVIPYALEGIARTVGFDPPGIRDFQGFHELFRGGRRTWRGCLEVIQCWDLVSLDKGVSRQGEMHSDLSRLTLHLPKTLAIPNKFFSFPIS